MGRWFKAALVAFPLAFIGTCSIEEEAAVGGRLYLELDFQVRRMKIKNQIHCGFPEKLQYQINLER